MSEQEMIARADLTELAKRVEALDGPCRETDFAILCVVDPRALKSGPLHGDPRYTASLDSAMTLVPAERDPLDILEAAIESARDAQDGVYYLPLHITVAALRARAAMGEG